MNTVNFVEAVASGQRMKTGMIDLVGYRLNTSFRSRLQMLEEMYSCNHEEAFIRMVSAEYELEEKIIDISESEYKELLEIKAKYEGLCR